MPATYELISSTNVTTTQASVTFSSIPATYTDLRLVFSGFGSGNFGVRVNGDTGANYNYTYFAGGGGTVDSGYANGATYMPITAYGMGLSATIQQFYTVDFFSYADSTYKTALSTSSEDQNTVGGYVVRQANLWRNTNAINSITALGSTDLQNGSVVSLYGILRA
jgi:hypothetical protein